MSFEKIQDLSGEWTKWIQDNLGRGCSQESIIERMIENNFEPFFATTSVSRLAKTDPLYSAGAYIYETPRISQTENIIKTADRDVLISLRMNKPVIALFDNLLSHEECDELVRLSNAKLTRSTIVDPKTGQSEVIEARSSYGTYFTLNENPFIAKLDKRIATVMNWPIENGEGIQILNYRIGGEYKPHFDYFSPDESGSGLHLAKGGQRVSTLIMYLNDVEGAGETIFPSIGLSVTPKKGSALYFEYCNSHNQVDPLTLHGGNPVTAGSKWIATKWMRQNKFS